MKTKQLQETFTRNGFLWELINRKETSKLKDGYLNWKKWGLYAQWDKTKQVKTPHYVVCRILDITPHPQGDNLGYDKVERIPTDRAWGKYGNTYETQEEAQNKYDEL